MAAGCGANEAEATAVEALHGAGPTPDTTFTAVGSVGSYEGGCTASFLSDHTALLSAHCFAALGHHCWDNAYYTSFGASITLWMDGSTATETYTIDQIATHPAAYLNLSTCGPSATNTCSSGAHSASLGSIIGHDLALVHFMVGPTQTSPSGHGATFRPVITSVTDSASTAFGTHVVLDMTTAITSSTAGWMVGMGNDDYAGGPLRLPTRTSS